MLFFLAEHKDYFSIFKVAYKHEELNIYNIEVFVGCSVGSIICLLSSIGYKAEELIEIALNINFADFKDISSDNVFIFRKF